MTPPSTDFHRQRNLEIERAHLMIQRGELAEARRFLEQLRLNGPRDPDVEALLAEIYARSGNEKAKEESGRAWRYWLNLNTSWRRSWWGVGASALLLYGIYAGAGAI